MSICFPPGSWKLGTFSKPLMKVYSRYTRIEHLEKSRFFSDNWIPLLIRHFITNEKISDVLVFLMKRG